HMTGALGHDAHLGYAGTGIRRSDIAPAQAVDEIAHGLEQGLALAGVRVANDHRLAATQWQTRQRRVVGDAAPQAQHIALRLLLRGVVPDAVATLRRTRGAVVNGDDVFQATGLVVAVDRLFLLIEVDVCENGHRVTSDIKSRPLSSAEGVAKEMGV